MMVPAMNQASMMDYMKELEPVGQRVHSIELETLVQSKDFPTASTWAVLMTCLMVSETRLETQIRISTVEWKAFVK